MARRRPWFGLDDPACEAPRVAVIGLPFDGTSSLRAGAAQAPAKLRELSTTSDPITRRGRVIEGVTLRDFGDVAPGQETTARDYLARVGARLGALPQSDLALLIGGDNSVSIAGLEWFARRHGTDAGVIWFDAHPDLFEQYDSNRDSHACALRRGLSRGGLSPKRAVLLATRSMAREEREFIDREGIEVIGAADWIASNEEAVAGRCAARLKGAPAVYLALDVDGFDASCAPGTGYPMPGGPSADRVFRLVESLFAALPIRVMDVTEIAPPLDSNDMTGFLGCQVVLEALGAIGGGGSGR